MAEVEHLSSMSLELVSERSETQREGKSVRANRNFKQRSLLEGRKPKIKDERDPIDKSAEASVCEYTKGKIKNVFKHHPALLSVYFSIIL